MLSDLSYSTLHVDMPTPRPDEDHFVPLNFDDLLDIAREFEFTRTITHIWPCEEEPRTCHEPTGLEDILAAIVPTPNAESPLPLPSSALSMTLDPVHDQEIDLHRSASTYLASDANASISRDPVPLSEDNDQVRAEAEPPIASILQGWSPPNGSQFLDLDDSLMLPQSPRDASIPSWLASFLAPSCTPFTSSDNQSPATGDVQPLPTSATDKIADDPRKKSVPCVPLPVQLSTRVILEPVQARSALQNVSSQTAIIPHTKTPKSRPRLPSNLAMGGASTLRHAKAPRGGIPPHIARTVTKANILLVEKERKVIRDTFSSTTMGEGRKPSVLRRAAKVGRETSKTVGGENDKKEGRPAKRARV